VSEAIYQEALMRLAVSADGAGRLTRPDASARRDNPLCGDEVTLDLRLRDGRVEEVGHRVRGCLLCRAAAAALARGAVGRSAAELDEVRARLEAMLRAAGSPPEGVFADLSAFLPVREVASRHACVLLPFDVLADALRQAKG
jgi:nitrogen fixation protein NifU and related proteins